MMDCETQPRQVSTLGNISMALGILAFMVSCGGLVGMSAFPSENDAPPSTPLYERSDIYVMMTCGGLPLAMIGALAGAVGAFHPERSKALPIAGLAINGVYLFCVGLAIACTIALIIMVTVNPPPVPTPTPVGEATIAPV